MGKGIKTYVLVITLLVLCSSCSNKENVAQEQDLHILSSAEDKARKKVILIVVDSLQSAALEAGIKQQQLQSFSI